MKITELEKKRILMLYENKVTFTFPYRGLPFKVGDIGLTSTFSKIEGLDIEWSGIWNNIPSKEELENDLSCVNDMDWLSEMNDNINYGGNNFFIPTYDRNNLGLVWLECNNGKVINAHPTGMNVNI